MEKQTKHIYSKCPKCGHWCETIPAESWNEKFSLTEDMVEQDLEIAVAAEKTKLRKFGMRTFGEVFHFPMTFIYSSVNFNTSKTFKSSFRKNSGFKRRRRNDKLPCGTDGV